MKYSLAYCRSDTVHQYCQQLIESQKKIVLICLLRDIVDRSHIRS